MLHQLLVTLLLTILATPSKCRLIRFLIVLYPHHLTRVNVFAVDPHKGSWYLHV